MQAALDFLVLEMVYQVLTLCLVPSHLLAVVVAEQTIRLVLVAALVVVVAEVLPLKLVVRAIRLLQVLLKEIVVGLGFGQALLASQVVEADLMPAVEMQVELHLEVVVMALQIAIRVLP